MSGFENISKVEPKPWVQQGTGEHELDHQLRNLKTVSTLDPAAWVRLARWYKLHERMEESEIAYIGARYCDFSNRELMEEWLAVFSFNRWGMRSANEIVGEANRCDGGMCDVANHEGRRLEELQNLLFALDKPKART